MRGRWEGSAEPEEVVRQRAFEVIPENAIFVRDDLLGCHRWVTATNAKLRKPYPSPHGLVTPAGSPCLSIIVSKNEIHRALRIWDAILKAAEKRGFKVEARRRHNLPEAFQDIVIDVLGEPMFLSLEERVRKSERSLTPEEERKRRDGPRHSIADRNIYTPTAAFKLSVRQEERGRIAVQFVDKLDNPLEKQLGEMMIALVAKAVERKAARFAEEKRRKQAAIDEAASYQRRQLRENALKGLYTIEALAERWERAQRLRAFAAALEAGVAVMPPAQPAHRADQIAWIRERADWLDPLVRSSWPEVDVPDHFYHYDDWMTKYSKHERTGVDDVLVAAGPENGNDPDG